MDIQLLYHTPEPERVIATAARLCYSPATPSQLNENMTDEQITSLIDKLVKMKHFSTFEHASFTFSVEGASRACTHQLVRHRLASYNQQSQRYVKFDENTLTYNMPGTIADNRIAKDTYDYAMKICQEAYQLMLDENIPAEDARYILPNGITSNIIVTMNARELIHFFSLRCCNRSQWEIREIAWRMLKLCKAEAPKIFKFAGPQCMTKICPEGKLSCGKPYSITSTLI